MSRAVEIAHQTTASRALAVSVQLVPLSRKGILLILPPAHVDAAEPDGTVRQLHLQAGDHPAAAALGRGNADVIRRQHGQAAEHRLALFQMTVGGMGEAPRPGEGAALLLQQPRRRQRVVIRADLRFAVAGHVTVGLQRVRLRIGGFDGLIDLLHHDHIHIFPDDRVRQIFQTEGIVPFQKAVRVQRQYLQLIL